MSPATVATDAVDVVGRHRVDLGDIEDLAASIAADGLLHPIVVTNDARLIAGHRRLEACRMLGWGQIPVTFIADVTDAARLLRMERDENTCRKDMTPSEKVSLGRALEELERPKARERQAEAGARNLPNAAPSFVRTNGTSDTGSTEKFDTREVVAPAVGMSTATYSRAKQLVTAAESGDEQAKAQVEEMDRTGKVTAPYEAWKGHKVNQGEAAVATRPALAPRTRLAMPQPPRYGGNRRKHLQVLDALATALAGASIAAAEIEAAGLDSTVTAEEATRLTGDLSVSIRSLQRINNLLKERTR